MPGTPVCVSVLNMKGGVGKTTIASLLCRHAARNLHRNVLAVDLDPQANLSQAIMGPGYTQFIADGSPSIVELFNGYQPPTAGMPSPSPLDVANITIRDTAFGGTSLELIPSRFDFSDSLVDSLRFEPRTLARVIASHFSDKDLIVIDCPPTESVLTRASYHASRYILVPVKPEFFATIGFPLLNDSLENFRAENQGHRIDVIGVVINNGVYHLSGNRGGPEKAMAMAELRQEAESSGWRLFHNEIPYSREFPKKMRGNFIESGNSNAWRFDLFAAEFFGVLDNPEPE